MLRMSAEEMATISANRIRAYAAASLYLLTILFVNIAFTKLPVVHTPLGIVPTMAFFVGLVFIMRDYTQRYAGHYVLIAMWLGLALSVVLADPRIALVSGAAFIVSELIDWAVYTVTKKPFQHRVLISSAIAIPVDSALFLFGIGMGNPGSIIAMSLSKFAASLLLYFIYQTMEGRNARRGS